VQTSTLGKTNGNAKMVSAGLPVHDMSLLQPHLASRGNVMKSAIPLFMVLAAALAAPTTAQEPADVAVKADKDRIDFLIGKQLVTSYHVKDSLPRPFFWPLKTIDGIDTTRDWPMGPALPGEKTDHPHHRSVWFCYGDVIPEGMKLKTKVKGVEGIDFWSETKGHGKIICVKVGEPKVDKEKIWITTQNEWRTTEGEKVLDETRKIGFYNQGKSYLIVLDIDLIASIYPITFGDTKEGAMALRIHPEINVKNVTPGKGKIENADGKVNEAQCWGQKSAWCDYSGPIGDKVVGVAILDDPRNPVPACWHARDYGLMAANPFGRDKLAKFPAMKGNNDRVHLAKGEHLNLRYGIVVHSGDATQGGVMGTYRFFARLRQQEN
jgi:hypothetical protein